MGIEDTTELGAWDDALLAPCLQEAFSAGFLYLAGKFLNEKREEY